MKWDFTPSEVMEGEVNYSLEDFFRNLWEEAKSRVSKKDFNHLPNGKEKDRRYNEAIREVFNFEYGLCYLSVIKKSYLKHVLKHSGESDREIIEKAIEENKGNIDMLHAIFIRHIERGLNKGLTKKQAAKAAVEYSKGLFFRWNKHKHKHKKMKDNN